MDHLHFEISKINVKTLYKLNTFMTETPNVWGLPP